MGRDGVNVPLRHGAWKEGATATVSVMDRRGKRVGTVYLGQMPEAGQTTLTAPIDGPAPGHLESSRRQSLRLVSVSDDGYHPSDYYHSVLKKMPDPQRPWRHPHVDTDCRLLPCLPLHQAAGGGPLWPCCQGRAWAKQMRKHLKTQSDGITRVLQSASALRRKHGLWGTPKVYDQAYASLKKRTHWMRYRHYSSQRLPIGSGITEAACKTVFTQRLKRSGMSWTIAGGQVILDLRVLWLSGVWETRPSAVLGVSTDAHHPRGVWPKALSLRPQAA